jgi:hypothetical protein
LVPMGIRCGLGPWRAQNPPPRSAHFLAMLLQGLGGGRGLVELGRELLGLALAQGLFEELAGLLALGARIAPRLDPGLSPG